MDFPNTATMKPAIITDHLPALNKIIHENDVEYLALYGSFARGEQKPDSDLDLLVSFKKRKGLFDLIGLQNKLSDLFDVKVDLLTRHSLSKYVKPYIQDDLQVIYAEKS